MRPRHENGSQIEIDVDEFNRARMGLALAGNEISTITASGDTKTASRELAHIVLAGNMALYEHIQQIDVDLIGMSDLKTAAEETIKSGVKALYGSVIVE